MQVVTAQTPSPTAGGVSATVNVGVRSITVAPTSVAYADCSPTGTSTTLAFPNGACRAPSATATPTSITVTNGTASAYIRVFGTDFATAGGASPWQLCAASTENPDAGSECNDTTDLPGADEARVRTVSADLMSAPSYPVTNSSRCDFSFNGTCNTAAPGEEEHLYLRLMGPSSSTDTGPTFSHTVTWGAYP